MPKKPTNSGDHKSCDLWFHDLEDCWHWGLLTFELVTFMCPRQPHWLSLFEIVLKDAWLIDWSGPSQIRGPVKNLSIGDSTFLTWEGTKYYPALRKVDMERELQPFSTEASVHTSRYPGILSSIRQTLNSACLSAWVGGRLVHAILPTMIVCLDGFILWAVEPWTCIRMYVSLYMYVSKAYRLMAVSCNGMWAVKNCPSWKPILPIPERALNKELSLSSENKAYRDLPPYFAVPLTFKLSPPFLIHVHKFFLLIREAAIPLWSAIWCQPPTNVTERDKD